MKRHPSRSILACIIGILLSGASLATQRQSASLPPSHIDPAAQALLNQVTQALGGSAFLDSKTLETRGRAFSIMDGVAQGFVDYQSTVEFPDKRRLSYGVGKSKSVTLINDGNQGWEVDRYGLIEQTDKEIKAWRLANHYSLENLLRVRIHEPGILIQKGGQDFVNNRPALIVDIVDARQVDVKLYASIQTYLPMEIAYRLMNPQTHEWDEYADIYADYLEVEGIETPMHLARYVNGERVAETFRNQARYNQSCPPGFFQPGS